MTAPNGGGFFRDTGRYVIRDGQPVKEPDLVTWAMWMEHHDRTVGLWLWHGRLRKRAEPFIQVSTVFLGLDHAFGRTDVPVLWETMIFGKESRQLQWRYSSVLEAARGHQEAVVWWWKQLPPWRHKADIMFDAMLDNFGLKYPEELYQEIKP